jgi:hypothetical protein
VEIADGSGGPAELGPELIGLIVAGDGDALAGFYDARAGSVHEYCAEVCAADVVDDAVLATFVDFLGRARAAAPGADPDDLLRKSTRTAAASRIQFAGAREAACRSTAELVAARANGELPHDERAINDHLDSCRSCRRLAQRLVEGEDALIRPAAEPPPERVRAAWLEIASRSAPDSPAPSWTPQTETPSLPRAAATAPADTGPQTTVIIQRRGGLLGAARRAVSSTRRR